jgi:hypothetical protein
LRKRLHSLPSQFIDEKRFVLENFQPCCLISAGFKEERIGNTGGFGYSLMDLIPAAFGEKIILATDTP